MKKDVIVSSFVDSLSENQWNMISQLLGREILINSRKNLISRLFKKTISVPSRKGKARTLQKWVCEQISKYTGVSCGIDEEITSREMGQSGTDVRLSKEMLKRFPFSVECKNQETWSLPGWILQAKKNMIPGTNWILFLTKNGHEEVVVLDATVFFKHLEIKKII